MSAKFKIGDKVTVNEPAQYRGKISIVEKVSDKSVMGYLYTLPIDMGYFFEEWLSLTNSSDKTTDWDLVEHLPCKQDEKDCHLCKGSGKRVMFNKSVECDCLINGRITLVEEKDDPTNWAELRRCKCKSCLSIIERGLTNDVFSSKCDMGNL